MSERKGEEMPTFLANSRKDKSACPATREAVGPKKFRSCVSLTSLRQSDAPGAIKQACSEAKAESFILEYPAVVIDAPAETHPPPAPKFRRQGIVAPLRAGTVKARSGYGYHVR